MLTLATKFKPAKDAFLRAHQAGFAAVEFWLNRDLLADWRDISRTARQSAMSYALHFPNSLNLGPESLRHAVELYRSLDCQAMVIHQPMVDCFAESILAIDQEICLAVENHILSKDEFARWANENPALTLDVEHLWKFTLRDAPLDALLDAVEDFLARYADKLKHVHLPGYIPGEAEHRPMNRSHKMVQQVLSRLARAEFHSFIVSEVATAFQNVPDMRVDAQLFAAWQRAFYDTLASG